MAEPLGVAFVEIEPIAVGFRAKTEALMRTQLAGASASGAASTRAAAGHRTETVALQQKAVAANGAAGAETRAAAATAAHGSASAHAARHIGGEAAAMVGLRSAATSSTAALAGVAVAGFALFRSLEQADEFEHAMHEIEAATHATRAEMEEAAQAAITLGEDLELPLTTANEAAEAINFLARSGFDLRESMTAARGALLLATAGGEDLETSVRNVDRILDAFNLTAEDSVRVADAVATGLKFTQGNASEFAQALATIAPAADSLGLSLEDTNTLVLQLSESGLSTTQATGSLRQAFLKLAAGGKGVNDGLKRIGLSIGDLRDEMGRLRPDAFVILAEATEELDRAQRLQVLTQIFSRRAALGVIRIIEQQRVGFELMAEKARDTGVAQEEATAKSKSFTGQLTELKDEAADVGLILGQALLPSVLDFTSAVKDAIQPTVRWIEKLQDLTESQGGLPGVIGRAKVAAQDYVNVIGQITGADEPIFITPTIEDNVARRRIRQAREEIVGLFEEFKKAPAGSLTAANELVLALEKVKKTLITTTPAGEAAAKEIGKLVKAVQDGSDLPPIVLDVEVDVDAGVAADKAAAAAEKAGDNVTAGFIRAGQLGFPAIRDHGLAMVKQLVDGARAAQAEVETVGEETVRRFSLGAQVAIAQASGNEAAQLSALRAQLDNAKAHQARMEALFRQGKVNEQAVINAANRVTSIQTTIDGILASQAADAASAAADAEAHAAEVEQAADKRDDAFIKAQQRLITTREGAVTAAGSTAPLADDITANVKLRDALTKTIAETRARIRQVRAAGRDTEALAAQLAQLRESKNKVKREIDQLQAQAREQQAATRVESAELDLQIAEARIGDDPSKRQTATLVGAHQKVINALKRQQGLTKKRSVEYKRLQVQIEQEKAAIRDLKKASKADAEKTGRTFAQDAFQFMQTLTGFSANLASNLIPGGITGGLVGGGGPPPAAAQRPVGSPFTREAAGGGTTRPVSAGQGNAQITLLRQVRDELRKVNRGNAHPEASAQRRRGAAAGDYQYQGTHGM